MRLKSNESVPSEVRRTSGLTRQDKTYKKEGASRPFKNGFQEEGSRPKDPDTELKAQARAIARGIACPSATRQRIAEMVSKGYLTLEQAEAAGFAVH